MADPGTVSFWPLPPRSASRFEKGALNYFPDALGVKGGCLPPKSKQKYDSEGFVTFENIFDNEELGVIAEIVYRANTNWKHSNPDFNTNTINSAYLTSKKYLKEDKDRDVLFSFIASSKLVGIAQELIGSQPYFLNTQLFFDPSNADKRPYWHRDVQYFGISEEEQQEIIRKDTVLHFRIPLATGNGIAIIPGSHTRWDTDSEREIRLEINGHKNSETIDGAIIIPDTRKNLVVFSAHAIHRGVYGNGRCALDIIYTSFKEKQKNVNLYDHFPDTNVSLKLPHPGIFETQ